MYYPDAADPVREPGVAEFMRAVQLTASDIADFLQTKRVGRLVDVSADTAWRTWELGHRVAADQRLKALNRWYKKIRPVWQAARYRSPIMWTGLAVRNVAIRAVQPAVVSIVAHRAVQLYSGQLVS